MSARVRELWETYAAGVMPPGAGAVQRQEMRRAFYAGVQGILGLLVMKLEPDHEPTAADLRMMDEIAAELVAFETAVQEGRA